MDTDTGTLEIPSLTAVPTLRAPMPTLAIPSPTKSPADILRDPRFAKLPAAEQTAIKKMVAARITGTPTATAGAMSSAITPGRPISKPIMPELARKAKLGDQAQSIIRLGTEMQNLYEKKIKPKLDSGQISAMGQGLKYTYPGILGHTADPDVQDFITKSGQFATLVNSYYAQSGGGRGGVQAYETITMPHIPHPPSGARELLTGSWDLQKQGAQLPTILKNVELEENKRPVETYGDLAPAAEDPVAAAMRKHGMAP